MSRRSMWLVFCVTIVSLACYSRAARNPYGRWLAQAIDTIESQYIEPVDTEKLFEGAMRGMVGRLDDYSSFLPRQMKTFFDEALEQQYGGVGIEVNLTGTDDVKRLTVVSARIGGPAYEAGVLAGDEIVDIDDVNTERFTLDDGLKLLRGKPGTTVTLRVRRAGYDEPLEFKITRALIKIESVLGDVREKDGSWNYLLPGTDRIGYVRITSFGDLTVGEFADAMKWLSERHCRGLVIDLRNNPGGLLDAAHEICDLFLPSGSVIVTTRGRDARVRQEWRATGSGPYQDLPLVVLVNGQSASASEIVAACLQDHGRAKIVGERSFGKGTVQNLIPVEAGRSSLKLTIATYWRPSEKNIHRMSTSKDTDDWGVRPDADGVVALDPKEEVAWQEARRQRDGRSPPPGDANNDGVDTSDPLQFDSQLRRAVDELRLELDGPAAAKAA
ncbi:MAG: S41 family peptidase [Pirellulales bacterium]